jgi:hypothetical protein
MSEYGDTTVGEPTEATGYDIDVDGDGVSDDVTVVGYTDGSWAVVVDTDHDGTADMVGVDSDGDGRLDTVLADRDADGRVDTTVVDRDEDGRADVVVTDSDGDGVQDTVTYGDGGANPYTLG